MQKWFFYQEVYLKKMYSHKTQTKCTGLLSVIFFFEESIVVVKSKFLHP